MTGVIPLAHSIGIRIQHNGKIYYSTLKIEPTPKNLKYASAKRTMWREQLAKGEKPQEFVDSSLKLQHYLDEWMRCVRNDKAISTIHLYKTYHNEMSEAFGNMKVDELTIGIVKKWCRSQRGCAKTINCKLSFLRSALGEAYDDEAVTINILKNWTFKKPVKTVAKQHVNPFTRSEQAKILDAFTKEQVNNLFQFMFWSGLRTSEAVALRWEDIDFENSIIKVRRARTQHAKKAASTKTAKSLRDVKMLSHARQALMSQRGHTQLQGAEVFLNPNTNKPWDGDKQIRKHWTWALRRAGVEYRNPYQTRHTFASMVLIAGEKPMWLKEQLGHTTLTMIIQHYGAWIPTEDNNEGSKVEKMFG